MPPPHVFLHVLIALAAVIALGQILAWLLKSIHQPPVIGEIIAGILLGPSLIGAPAAAAILPPAAAPFLEVLAQFGVLLYMFLVGLELHSGLLKQRLRSAVVLAAASMLTPFLLGGLLAFYLYPRLSESAVPFTHFALFMAIALSVTAFPVLARILADFRMTRSELGIVALGSAALGDVAAWCLLAFVVSIVKAQLGNVAYVLLGVCAYLLVLILLLRPLLAKIAAWHEHERLAHVTVIATYLLLLASAIATEAIGIHALFGAFAVGALIPHDSSLARTLTLQLKNGVTLLLLPAFFALTGMRTRVDLLAGWPELALCAVIIAVATAGKFGGACLGARLTGWNWRDSAVLGALMNTRGLMELIVLNVGLDLKIISPALFAMMVIMALVTTMGTGPVLQFLSKEPRIDVRGS